MTECVLVPLQRKHTHTHLQSAALQQCYSYSPIMFKGSINLFATVKSTVSQQTNRWPAPPASGRAAGPSPWPRTAALGNVVFCPTVRSLQDLFKYSGSEGPKIIKLILCLSSKAQRAWNFIMKLCYFGFSILIRGLVGICGVEVA